MNETIAEEYGHATLTPTKEVTAGTYGCWKVTYNVGQLGMDDGSTLKIAANMTSDWGVPQFDSPADDNYATVTTSGDATVEAFYDPQGHVRPWKQTVTIDIFDGSLDNGETISLIFGDRSGGSLGHRAQTFPEEDFQIAVLVDPFGTEEFVELPEKLTFDIVPGTADGLTAVAPSIVVPGQTVPVSIRAEDFWGNTATGYEGRVNIATDDEVIDTSVAAEDGIASIEVSFDERGTYRLTVHDAVTGLKTTTNPVIVGDSDGSHLFWGDIHGQSGETVGTGTIWEYLEYARDNAFLDFTSHAGNDFQITDEFWEEIQDAIKTFHDPGEFVTFLCYEWSANTSRGGDHNIYFRGDEADIHRSSSWQIVDGTDKHTGLHPVDRLYEHYSGRDDVLIIPHQGGRPATLEAFDPELSPFLEIVSVWGIFEWFGQEALKRGYKVGFVGGSDDHSGRPGATAPTNQTDFNIEGGLMAVRADELTRESVWEAFKQRRCYATTGARIFLETNIENARMGDTVTVDGALEMSVTVEGTAPLSRIDLFRGADHVATTSFDDGDQFVEFIWSGARSKTRHKVQDWSGGLSIDQGRISAVDEFGFDHPEQGVTHCTDTSIRWDGATSGNYQGVRISFDVPPDTEVSFATAPVTTTFSLNEVEDEIVIDAGHLDQQLEVRQVGNPSKTGAQVTLNDECVRSGTNPYYVRVRQVNGEMAWSSPIFVEVL